MKGSIHSPDRTAASDEMTDEAEPIGALVPRGAGRQFVVYGDSCSGVPAAPHEATFAGMNRVVARLVPAPQFVLFPGDEIIGLTNDPDALRAQWRYWLETEMRWLSRRAIPVYHTTSNHTTYDETSEAVFCESLPHLPRNGPADQRGLSYFVRDGDLLMVFVNTAWSGLGGEGHVETTWLSETLRGHADARYKLVVGHHPVHAVNGFGAPCQHVISPDHAGAFWRILVANRVFAYVCSHILAFDVQVHEGVLQITSAGAGTRYRMPEGFEYLHCLQAALDEQGLRYQVLDSSGHVRERLSWPVALPAADGWEAVEGDGRVLGTLFASSTITSNDNRAVALRFRGRSGSRTAKGWQTLLSAATDEALAPVWLGLRGPCQRLTVIIGAERGRSPHYWHGPEVPADALFDFQIMVHAGMGPGGILYRDTLEGPWTSLSSSSAWGADRLVWPHAWHVGHGQYGIGDRPFLGSGLIVTAAAGQPR